MNKEQLREKAAGCLVGLAVGDAMGDVGRDQYYRSRFGFVTDLPPEAKSTDDTEFAMLTARTLIDNHGVLTPESVLASWRKYILDQGGIHDRAGRPLIGAVENIKRGILPPYSGIDNVFNNDDGAAMRIAPVGIVYAGDPEKAAEMAAIEAQISHDKDGIWAAQAVAASVAVAMVDSNMEKIIDAGREHIPQGSWLGRAMDRAINICQSAESFWDVWAALHTDFWTPEHAVVTEALPQVYGLFHLTKGDFIEGMTWASNFGRDADTIAAIVGALAGAREGITAIPENWVRTARKPSAVCLKFSANEDIVQLAEELSDLISVE
jgi:ADP-ribosylglycohydrolase